MTHGLDGLKRNCARLAVVLTVAMGASACSSVPDWVDPTTWVGNSSPADNQTAAGETPDLASLPDRPTPTSTADEKKQVEESLTADRSRAKYSSDALRGGTEAAAAPPPPPSPADQVAAAQSAPPPTPPPAPSTEQQAPAPDTSSAPPPQAVADATPPPAPAPAMTSAPAAPPPPMATAMVQPSDAALGFKPSSAPPLDPSIAQFVAPPILARYQQTAVNAGAAPLKIDVASTDAPKLKHSRRSRAASNDVAMGGPEKMSGAVVANLDAIQAPATSTASVYANPQGLPPTSVVFFPGDGTLLNSDGRAQVRAAVAAFKQHGGQGYIRVVGHSASRTSNMPLEQHLMVIFNKSQDRANAVAKEIIREGVPANRVLVEAVGDSQPVYYESMPKGEDGNRRAEIFLQS